MNSMVGTQAAIPQKFSNHIDHQNPNLSDFLYFWGGHGRRLSVKLIHTETGNSAISNQIYQLPNIIISKVQQATAAM